MSPSTMALALLVITTIPLTWAFAGALKIWAVGRGLLDVPNERSSHGVAVPRLGGIAMGGAIGLVLVACRALDLGVPVTVGGGVIAASAALLATVGAVEDVRALPFTLRLAVHVLVSAAAVWVAWQAPGAPAAGVWRWAVAIFWLTGLINAYNFMDGVDGIAGGQAIVAGIGWAAIGWSTGWWWIGAAGAVIAAAAAGFLLHNWHPASLFMGDAGATTLGYLFGAFVVLMARTRPASAAIGVALLWPFVFDTAFTFATRLSRRDNVFAAHRTHLYQRLVTAGWRHDQVAWLYGALSAGGAIVAWALSDGRASSELMVAAILFGAGLGLRSFVRREEHRGRASQLRERVRFSAP